MRTKPWLSIALFLSVLASPALGQSPERFSAAKKLLAGIHEEIGHLQTLYCACPYVRTSRSGGDIDREACGLKARKNAKRSDRVEWEHVVPASWFGSHRTCWKEGHAAVRGEEERQAIEGSGSVASSLAWTWISRQRTTTRTTSSPRVGK